MLEHSVPHLRRWGVGWWSIFKCAIGLHWAYVVDAQLVCGRCGRVLVDGPHEDIDLSFHFSPLVEAEGRESAIIDLGANLPHRWTATVHALAGTEVSLWAMSNLPDHEPKHLASAVVREDGTCTIGPFDLPAGYKYMSLFHPSEPPAQSDKAR